MRNFLTCLIVLGVSGCGLELLTTAAVQGKLQTQSASTAAHALQYAKNTTGKTNAQRAIDLYKGDKGENPPSLEALVPAFLDKVPVHDDGSPYGYDPVTGTLLDKPVPLAVAAAPAAPTGGDWETLTTINASIQRYVKDTGTYPASLYSLVPNYLPAVPKTAGGQDFTYDPQYGAAYLPQASGMPGPAPAVPAAPRAGAAGGGVGGAGLMGETMTGIAISNQLDSMNNSGTTGARSHADGSLERSQDLHNQQQEQALKDAGM